MWKAPLEGAAYIDAADVRHDRAAGIGASDALKSLCLEDYESSSSSLINGLGLANILEIQHLQHVLEEGFTQTSTKISLLSTQASSAVIRCPLHLKTHNTLLHAVSRTKG